MTTEQLKELEWCAARLAELTPALSNPRARVAYNAANVLVSALNSHVAAKFPEYNQAADMSVAGPLAWKVLHKRALLLPVHDAAAETVWLKGDFRKMLPCSACRSFLDEYLVKNPPNFAKYFEWTVAMHNAVNVKLAKKEIPLGEATAIWKAAK